MDRVERRLDATTKLILQGMKMLVKYQQETRRFQEENRYAIRALIDAQQRADARQDRADARQDRADARQDRADARLAKTEQLVNKLIQGWMKRSSNGH